MVLYERNAWVRFNVTPAALAVSLLRETSHSIQPVSRLNGFAGTFALQINPRINPTHPGKYFFMKAHSA